MKFNVEFRLVNKNCYIFEGFYKKIFLRINLILF